MKQVLAKILKVLGSFELAALLLVLLCVLTLFGTLEQQYSTLEDVQTQYFESLFVVHHWSGKLPIPWPGGMLLMPLLGINLLVGGILRLRMGRSTVGVFVVHLGMVVLLFGSLIEHSLSTRGFLTVAEGETSDEYVSYEEWELAIQESVSGRPARLYVIPESRIDGATGGDTVRFEHPDLPFDLLLSDYSRNAKVVRAEPDGPPGTVVDGFKLVPLDPVSQADKDRKKMNVPGVVVRLEQPGTEGALPAIIWPGPNAAPFRVTVADRAFGIDLRRRRWDLPFSIRLDRFVHETHPGTSMDRRFSSFVTKRQGGLDREIHITMNAPLRHEGYTLYQSGWGRDQGRYYSTFSVVANPSDRVPLIACVIIAIGLIIHFGRKLALHLKAQSRREKNARRAQDVPAGSST